MLAAAVQVEWKQVKDDAEKYAQYQEKYRFEACRCRREITEYEKKRPRETRTSLMHEARKRARVAEDEEVASVAPHVDEDID